MSVRERLRSSSISSRVAPTAITAGFIWEAVEVAHTLEYIRELIHRPELQQLRHFVGHISPLALIAAGLVWAYLQKKREHRLHAVEALPPAADDVVILRERTTTTTTTTEREYLSRRTQR